MLKHNSEGNLKADILYLSKPNRKKPVHQINKIFLIIALFCVISVGYCLFYKGIFIETFLVCSIIFIFRGVWERYKFYDMKRNVMKNHMPKTEIIREEFKCEENFRDIPKILLAVMLIFISLVGILCLWYKGTLYILLKTAIGHVWISTCLFLFLFSEMIVFYIYIIFNKEEHM